MAQSAAGLTCTCRACRTSSDSRQMHTRSASAKPWLRRRPGFVGLVGHPPKLRRCSLEVEGSCLQQTAIELKVTTLDLSKMAAWRTQIDALMRVCQKCLEFPLGKGRSKMMSTSFPRIFQGEVGFRSQAGWVRALGLVYADESRLLVAEMGKHWRQLMRKSERVLLLTHLHKSNGHSC